MPSPEGKRFIRGHETSHFKLDEWAYKYGEIFEIYSYGKRMIVLNSERLIRKAQSDAYRVNFGGRPKTFYGEHFAHKSQTIAFGCGETQLAMRKIYSKALHVYGDGVEKFEKIMAQSIRKMLSKIAAHEENDFDLYVHVKESLADIMCILLSGDTFVDDNAGYAIFWDFQRANNAILEPKVNLALEMFPFLRFLPGNYKRIYDILQLRVRAVEREFAEKALSTYVKGEIRGLVDALKESQYDDIANGREVVFTDDRISPNVTESVVSGLNTSSGTLASLFLDLIHYPECQDKIFQEVKDVIGLDRLPCLKDKQHMPYTEAFTLESQRYTCPITSGLGRAVMVDTMFESYQIRKGDYLIMNLWHMHHNKDVWGDPWTFRPERFLDDDGQVLPQTHTLMRNCTPFGTGTRMCIADNFARSRLFLFLTSVVQKFQILPPNNEDLVSCDPRTYEIGLILHPSKVNCRVIPH